MMHIKSKHITDLIWMFGLFFLVLMLIAVDVYADEGNQPQNISIYSSLK